MIEFTVELKDAGEFSISSDWDDLLRENPKLKIACIVLPTYNEIESLPRLLPLIFRESEDISTHKLHVLVVDDNSPDGTGDCVRTAMPLYPRLHLITGEKKGLGDAYQRGISYAMAKLEPDLILQMDADFQHDPAMLPQFIEICNHGYDLVIGSRFLLGTDIEDFPWRRKFISLAGTKLVHLFSGIPPLTDSTSGFRCIRAELISKCEFGPCSKRGYSFQAWFLCELLRQGARYLEIPLPFPTRLYGHSKLTFRDKLEFALCLFNLPRWKDRVRQAAAPAPQQSARVVEESPDEVASQLAR